MASEDKVEEQMYAAMVELYRLKQVRPKQAILIGNNALRNLATIMGYELTMVSAQDVDTSGLPLG